MEPKNVPKIAQSIFSGRSFVRNALAYDTLALIISFWLQLIRERPYRQAACHHSGATSFVTRKGIHVES